MVLFINAVDELLSEKGLGFVTNIINIAFIVLLAILITKGVRRLMQRLQDFEEDNRIKLEQFL